MTIVGPPTEGVSTPAPTLEDEHPLEVGWKIYPCPPIFWRRAEVQALAPHLTYLGPLPQANRTTEDIVRLNPLPAYVYVIQDSEGDVLYVGKTINPVGRLASHRAKKAWWPRFGLLTMLGVEASDRREADSLAFRLEAIAIRDLEPRYNIAGVA